MLMFDEANIRRAESEEAAISTLVGALREMHLPTLGLILKVTWERFS